MPDFDRFKFLPVPWRQDLVEFLDLILANASSRALVIMDIFLKMLFRMVTISQIASRTTGSPGGSPVGQKERADNAGRTRLT